MTRWLSSRLARRTSALALPFLLGAAVLRLAIAPAGDAIASVFVSIAPIATAAPASDAGGPPVVVAEPEPPPVVDDEGERAGTAGPSSPRRIASRIAARRRAVDARADERNDAGADAAKVTLVVPAAVVTKALERRDVGAANAKAPDGTPLGARLHGVGKYRTGLRDGDIVVSVAGTSTPTVDAMVAAAMQAATHGAKQLSGQIVRGDATFGVVLELPK
jgi:hypothetical protein